MTGWYFSATDRKLGNGDNREIVIGTTHTVDAAPVISTVGLHASRNILDALGVAAGPVIYRVALSDDLVQSRYMSAARRRTYLAGGIDATDILRVFIDDCLKEASFSSEHITSIKRQLEVSTTDITRNAWHAARDATVRIVTHGMSDTWDTAWDKLNRQLETMVMARLL